MSDKDKVPPIIGAPIDWGALDDAGKRRLVAEAAQWVVDNPGMALPPGYAEALGKLASALRSLDNRPKDKPVPWLLPAAAGQQGQRLSPVDEMRRAVAVGTLRYYAKQRGHGALTRGRELLGAVYEAADDPDLYKRWEQEAKNHPRPEVRGAYEDAAAGLYARDLPPEAFTVEGVDLFKERLRAILMGEPVSVGDGEATMGPLFRKELRAISRGGPFQ